MYFYYHLVEPVLFSKQKKPKKNEIKNEDAK